MVLSDTGYDRGENVGKRKEVEGIVWNAKDRGVIHWRWKLWEGAFMAKYSTRTERYPQSRKLMGRVYSTSEETDLGNTLHESYTRNLSM